jgi:hypothetical protein
MQRRRHARPDGLCGASHLLGRPNPPQGGVNAGGGAHQLDHETSIDWRSEWDKFSGLGTDSGPGSRRSRPLAG